MKSIKNKNSNPRLLLIIITSVILALGLAAGVYAYYARTQTDQPKSTETTNNDGVNYDKPTEAQQQAGNDAKEDAIKESETPSTVSSISITSVNQANGIIQIRTALTGLDDEGICTLTLSMSGTTDVMKTAGTQTLGSYSVCQGFDIPTSELQSGIWQIKITYTGLGQTSIATSKVEVK